MQYIFVVWQKHERVMKQLILGGSGIFYGMGHFGQGCHFGTERVPFESREGAI